MLALVLALAGYGVGRCHQWWRVEQANRRLQAQLVARRFLATDSDLDDCADGDSGPYEFGEDLPQGAR